MIGLMNDEPAPVRSCAQAGFWLALIARAASTAPSSVKRCRRSVCVMYLVLLSPVWDAASDLAQAIESGYLVSFCQRGIVEHAIPEVLQRAAHAEHGLPDVDDLRGPLSDHVHPEDPQAVRIEEDL